MSHPDRSQIGQRRFGQVLLELGDSLAREHRGTPSVVWVGVATRTFSQQSGKKKERYNRSDHIPTRGFPVFDVQAPTAPAGRLGREAARRRPDDAERECYGGATIRATAVYTNKYLLDGHVNPLSSHQLCVLVVNVEPRSSTEFSAGNE